MISIAAGPPSSIVAGRFGVPTSGGGALAIVNGRIGLEGVDVQVPADDARADRGTQDRRLAAGFRLPAPFEGTDRSGQALPELPGRERREAAASGPRRQRRDAGAPGRHVDQSGRDGPDRRGGLPLRRRPLRQRSRHRGHARGRLPLPSSARLRRRREPGARRGRCATARRAGSPSSISRSPLARIRCRGSCNTWSSTSPSKGG